MKEEALKQLVENTFSKLADTMNGCSVYSEIEQALKKAYSLGEARQSYTQAAYADNAYYDAEIKP